MITHPDDLLRSWHFYVEYFANAFETDWIASFLEWNCAFTSFVFVP